MPPYYNLSTRERVILKMLGSVNDSWPETLGIVSLAGSLLVIKLSEPGVIPESHEWESRKVMTLNIPNDGGDP